MIPCFCLLFYKTAGEKGNRKIHCFLLFFFKTMTKKDSSLFLFFLCWAIKGEAAKCNQRILCFSFSFHSKRIIRWIPCFPFLFRLCRWKWEAQNKRDPFSWTVLPFFSCCLLANFKENEKVEQLDSFLSSKREKKTWNKRIPCFFFCSFVPTWKQRGGEQTGSLLFASCFVFPWQGEYEKVEYQDSLLFFVFVVKKWKM